MTYKRAYWILCILLAGVLVVLFLIPHNTETGEIATTDSSFATHQDFQRRQQSYTSQQKRYYNNRSERNWDADSTRSYSPTPKKRPLSIELNSADTLTLQLLYGIGPAYARRIVRYRNLLGGFISKEQLLEVYGFSEELYHNIEPHLTLQCDSINKIDINNVTLKQLAHHPYIDYYQARDLIALRNKGQKFECGNDLLLVPTIDSTTVKRILPYLAF